jgi:RHS repeat-associated protein
MAFSDSGTLYILDTWPQDLQNQKLLTVDKANAQILASVTLSQPIGPPNQPNVAGMSFDPETGLLFAGGSTDSLYTIDPASGTVKKVGLTGLPTNVSIAGLTLGSIPMEDYYIVTLAEGAVKDNLNFGNLKGTEQPNRNPSFTSQPPTQLQVGQELRYEAAATDLDNDPLLYDLPVKPIGMAVDEKMGTVVWTPTLDQEGTFDVILRVRDGFGGVALQPFQIVVGATNSGPIITSSPSGQGKAVVGVAYQYRVRAQDDSPEPIQFRLTSAPSGMAIDAATGILTYTPTQVGNPFVSIVAQDSQGRTSSQSFNLNVVATAPNSLPEITSQPRTSIGLGNTYAYQVVTQQADGDRLTYSLATAPQGMVIDSNGLLLWTPTPDRLGDRSVTVQVADARGGTVQQSFTLAVGSQTTNQAPSIVSTPTAAATVNRLYAYDIQVSDPDGDPVAFSLRQAPAGMSINPELGTVRWYPTLEQVGEQEVIVDAIDAQGGVTPHRFTLTVHGTNLPPVVTSAPLTQAVLNKTYTYTVQAKDAENQPLTFSLVNNPPAGMTIDAKTGKVQWTPTQLGGQAIDILVTDGQGGVNLHSYQLLVLETAPNQLPAIATQPVRTAVVGQPYQYTVIANDADSADLRFTFQDSPVGMAIDETTGLIQWQPDRAGEFPITIVVTDSNGGKAIQSFTLQAAVNQAPQVTSNPVLSVTAGLPYHYDLKVVDPDGHPVTYTLISGPPGMTLDRLGRLTWSPGIAEIGTHAVEIAVTDSYGAAVTQKYDLAVVQDEQKPQVEVSFSSDNVKPGDAVQLLASASDNVGVKALTLLVNGTPVPLDASGGGIFRPTQPGLVQIVATATDAAGNQTSQTKELRVIDPSDINAPTVAITSPTAGQTFTGLISITGTATDPQGLQFYRLEYARAGTNTFIPFTEGQTSVSNGVLGTLDPSLLANDDYLIRLTARDVNGNTATQQVQVGLSGGAKVGEFRLEFTDLAIPLTGIPIQVNRVYDSRESSRADDFGYGWSLGVQDAHITESVPTDPSEALLGLFVQRPFKKGDRVYLTNPQGERVGFTFDPVPALSFFGASLWRPRFVADAGVFDTLEDYAVSTSPGPLFIQQAADGTFRLPYFGFGYNPSAYKLTTKDGISYVYDQFDGLQTITDRNDNQLTFSDAGIISSTGQSIQFKRNSQGRIAEIVDPAGQSIRYSYDAKGDLIGVSDRTDNKTQFTYGTSRPHFLSEVIDPLGRSGVKSEYDDQGRLVRLIDADGNAVELGFDVATSTQTIIDALGNPLTLVYNERGNVIQEIDALGRVITRTYDTEDNLLSETDQLGNTTTYTYDGAGNILTETDPLGNVTFSTYNGNSQLLTQTNPLGNTLENVYDSNGNLIRQIDAAGNTSNFTYDALGNLTAFTDAKGNSSTFGYDSSGNLNSLVDPIGAVATFSYDANGSLLSQTDFRGNTNQFTYDAEGRVITVTDPNGNVTRVEYNSFGDKIATIDALGRRTELRYNDRGLITETIFPDETPANLNDNPRVLRQYDAADQLIALTDEAGRVTRFVYDELGRRIATIFPDNTPDTVVDNPRVRNEYDAAGRVIAEIDELGSRTEFEYDAARRLVLIRDALGGEQLFTYDANDRLVATTDALGNVTQNQFDVLDRLTQTIDALGNITSFVYDGNDNLIFVTDPVGNITRNIYDERDRLIEIIDPEGGRTQIGYDTNNNVTSIIDPRGNEVTSEYDARNQLINEIDPLGNTTSFEYDAVGNLIAQTDRNGQRTEFEYDPLNRLVGEVNPLGGEITFTYDLLGNLVAQIDELGRTTSFTYDLRDRLTEIINPLDGRLQFEYDAAGNLLSATDELGRTTSFTYDELNRQTSITNPLGNTTFFNYDLNSNLISTEDALGRTTLLSYDALDRLVTTTDALGGITTNTYDGNGNLIAFSDELGRTTELQYDGRDLLTTVIDPLGNESTTDYDANGNVIGVTDGKGNTTQFEYDALNRQISATDALGNVTSQTYDPEGNLLSISDSVGNTTNFAYDALNRLTSETNELGDSRTSAYDAVGNLITSVDRNGRERTFSYDDLDRLVQEQWLNGSGNAVENINYTYDAAGQLLTASDSDSSNSFTYDLGGRLTSVDNSGTPSIPEVVLTYGYDAVDNLTSVTDVIDGVAGGIETFTYDALDRVTSITQNGSNVAEKRVDFTYDAASQLTNLTRYNDLTGSQLVAATDYTYDLAGRLTELAHSQGLTDLATYSLTYDGANRVTQFTSPDGVATYNYDQISQVIGADYDFQGDETYSYDSNGNRTNSGYVVGANNQLLSDGIYNYEYDAEGNRTRRTEIATGTVTEYTWDYRNRLTEVVTRDSSGNIIQRVEAAYDAFDRRINLTVDADGDGAADTVENFVYDGSNIALVFDEAGNLSDRYLHGAEIDQILASEAADGTVLWALTDNQGTVRDILDADGNIINQITYDSYGNVTSQTNPAIDFRYGYTGRELDEATGLMSYRTRYYDPSTGQFISEDPLSFGAGDPNLYRYVFNSPINAIDPSGQISKTEFGLIVSNVVASQSFIGGAVGFTSSVFFQLLFGQGTLEERIRNIDWVSVGISTGAGIVGGTLGGTGAGAGTGIGSGLIASKSVPVVLSLGEEVFQQFNANEFSPLGLGIAGVFGFLGVKGSKGSKGSKEAIKNTVEKVNLSEIIKAADMQLKELVESTSKRLQDAVDLGFLDDIQLGPGGFSNLDLQQKQFLGGIKIDDLKIVWGNNIGKQGLPFEDYLASQSLGTKLPTNFKTFDLYDYVNDVAISAKTLDTTTRASLENPKQIFSTLKSYINKVDNFTSYTSKKVSLDENQFSSKEIRLAIPSLTNAEQWEQIQKAVDYGKSKNIKLVVYIVN